MEINGELTRIQVLFQATVQHFVRICLSKRHDSRVRFKIWTSWFVKAVAPSKLSGG